MFLAIDSSLGTSVAIVSNAGEILVEKSSESSRGHAEHVGHLISLALREAESPESLEGVVVGVGPGPFTGLRVGMVAAGVFSLSRDIPLLPVISHDAIAFGSGDVVVITDAKRGEVAYSVYQGNGVKNRLHEPKLCRAEDLEISLGEFSNLRKVRVSAVSAGALGQVAMSYVSSEIEFDSANPRYLRSPDVTVRP